MPRFSYRPGVPLALVAAMLLGLGLGLAPQPAGAQEVFRGHGIAMHGDMKYGPDFKHFEYVNPDALKGGEVKLATIGTFDSFNGFIIKGNPAAGAGGLYDSLLTKSADEAFTEYGLLAESVELPQDRSWVTFTLRPEARWHDGQPVTPEDVIWTFDTLRSKGAPLYRFYYANISKIEKVGERQVKFTFGATENRELPLIVGEAAILPKHYWEGREFDKTTLEPPLGSGPYQVDSFEPGRWVRYKRYDDYWGKDLPVNVGTNNFGTIQYDYYRDSTVQVEALKAGEFDFRLENSSKDWATNYDIPAVRDGLLKKQLFPNHRTAGMQGFVFNTRRSLFKDRRVREALGYAFDFEWSNKALFYGQYTRTKSYFDNSELAAVGAPTPGESAILEPFRDQLPPEVFGPVYVPPVTKGDGNIRDNLRQALKLLTEAGWAIDKSTRKLTNTQTGEVMAFEIMLVQPSLERIALPYAKNLSRLGIDARVRTVDTAQYRRRTDDFDFDMAVTSWGQSRSPGNEQREFWGSAAADTPGSRNLAGIKDPVIDALIELLIAAPDRKALVTRTRALDRVLRWGFWVVPHFHIAADRVLFWDKFGMPAVIPDDGFQFNAWWVDPAKAESLEQRKAKLLR